VGKILSGLGYLMGILSLVMLAKQGLELGFVAPLERIITYYSAVIDVLFGWADDPLARLVESLTVHFPDIRLQPHWKYILVPMLLYVGADCRVMWRIGRRRAAVFFWLSGGLLALVASIGAGAVPIDDEYMRPVLFPVGALFMFNFLQAIWDALFKPVPGRTQWQVFRYYAGLFAVGNLAIGAIVLLVGQLLWGSGISGINLLLILLLVGLLAIRDLTVSALNVGARRQPGQTWRQSFLSMANVRLGIAVLGTLGAALVFVGFNAGLVLAGL
jgi:hypothetical protein